MKHRTTNTTGREAEELVFGGLFGNELRVFSVGHDPGPCTVRPMTDAEREHVEAVLAEEKEKRRTDKGRPTARIGRAER